MAAFLRTALFAILVPSPILAQSEMPALDAPALRLMLCSRIKDDNPRLKCYDEALEALRKPAEPPKDNTETKLTEGWTFQENRSPVDDSPQISAILFAEKTASSIAFRCIEGKIDGRYRPDGFINSSRDGIRGLYRINSDKPVEVRWNPATNSRAAFFNGPATFLRSLPDDGKLFMRAFDFQGAAHDATFSLGKISEVRARVFAACAAAAATVGATAKTKK